MDSSDNELKEKTSSEMLRTSGGIAAICHFRQDASKSLKSTESDAVNRLVVH
jgi:hypothetical protein